MVPDCGRTCWRTLRLQRLLKKIFFFFKKRLKTHLLIRLLADLFNNANLTFQYLSSQLLYLLSYISFMSYSFQPLLITPYFTVMVKDRIIQLDKIIYFKFNFSVCVSVLVYMRMYANAYVVSVLGWKGLLSFLLFLPSL